MSETPYSKFSRDQLILRDLLATDRTILANERTFLAYVRTALTLFIAGASFIKFFNSLILQIVGYIFVPVGIITFGFGLFRYLRTKVPLNQLMKNPVSSDNKRPASKEDSR